MEHTSGESETRAEGPEVSSHMHLRTGPGTSTSGHERPTDDGQSPLGDLSDRALHAAGRAGERLRDRISRMGATFDERTGIVTAARDHPLAAVGFAFSAGYLLAVATGGDDGNWLVERARRRLKTLIISGVAAVLAQELRSLAGPDAPLGQLLDSLLGEFNAEDDYVA